MLLALEGGSERGVSGKGRHCFLRPPANPREKLRRGEAAVDQTERGGQRNKVKMAEKKLPLIFSDIDVFQEKKKRKWES